MRERKKIRSAELRLGTGRVFGNTGGPNDEEWAYKNGLSGSLEMAEKAFEATFFNGKREKGDGR